MRDSVILLKYAIVKNDKPAPHCIQCLYDFAITALNFYQKLKTKNLTAGISKKSEVDHFLIKNEFCYSK